jgi:hypothetical protein
MAENTETSRRSPRLNQIIAIEKGLKTKDYGDFSKLHKLVQSSEGIKGISRLYQKRDEDGADYPSEKKEVQVRVKDIIRDVTPKIQEIFDVTATKDFANTKAKADIVIDADTDNPQTLIKDVPVSYLLWVEKQLNDIYTFVSKLPTLPTQENWTWDDNKGCYRTDVSKTIKTKKTVKPIVMYEATEHHPAQVEKVSEDIPIGHYDVTHFSGALPVQEVENMKDRVKKLQIAVKFAREQANNTEAPKQRIGEKILGYVFQ